MENLIKIQAELKCPKGSYNSFGKYKYRSAEQILESVKPLLAKFNAFLTLSDSIVEIGSKLFLKSTATLKIGADYVEVFGFAEMGDHKGMSSEQCTGTASSYARKYALNGLFLIDETESDPDSKDNSKEPTKPANELPWLNRGTEEFETVKKALKAGQVTMAYAKSKYRISNVIESELIN